MIKGLLTEGILIFHPTHGFLKMVQDDNGCESCVFGGENEYKRLGCRQASCGKDDFERTCVLQPMTRKEFLKELKKHRRKKETWMSLTQEEIDDLDEEWWIHYKEGRCLCFAHCDCECVCGSWHMRKDMEK